MEYQKMLNFLDGTTNQPSRYRTRNWVKKMMNQKERIMPKMKLNLKLQTLKI